MSGATSKRLPISRFTPSAPNQGMIARSRLAERLQGRFDQRLTTITGAAGFGKSTLVAQAVRNNILDPWGADVFLGAIAPDNDAGSLLSGLASGLRIAASDDPRVAFDTVVGCALCSGC
ncbi:MAG: LuxR family maltose regulon positive regulatory protein [Candidatus Poriferisodalaceae bacterium]|jgi:LuxR family transcriptional regulator, maltose regulon positive regulatory protein